MSTPYKINPSDQKRYDAFAKAGASDMTQEIALMRATLERLAASEKPPVSVMTPLLRVLNAAIKDDHILRERAGSVIGRDTLVSIFQSLAEICSNEVMRINCTNREKYDCVDRISAKLVRLLDEKVRPVQTLQITSEAE